jgi:glucosylceramidase
MDRLAAGIGRALTPRRLSPICLALLIALAALLPAGAPAAGSPARAWLTTGGGADLLAEQPDTAFGAPAPDAPTISVDPAQSYQRIEGLGASITDSSAHLLAHSPHRDAIMRSLFDPRAGLGLSYLRQPMGASDFVAGPHYTYDDVGAGQTDFALRHFSIAHDRAEILPLLRQARALNPALRSWRRRGARRPG